jgi:hypothetical protein
MKKLLMLLVSLSLLSIIGCKDEEETVVTPTAKDPIVGVWISEGLNVPIGLRSAPFKVKKITATFNENKSYTVVQIDSANVTTTFTGTITYTASTSKDTVSSSTTKDATIYTIVANQATPSVVTSTGIYAISGSNMTYEIIQTTPALGVTPPTPAAGFGSTSVGSTKYPIYIQKYVKQ